MVEECSAVEAVDDASGDSLLKCQRCQRRFTYQCSLLIHEACDHADNRLTDFICPLCPEQRKFQHRCSLVAHLRTAHYSQDQALTCPICSRPFSSQSRLNDHVRIHSGERPFICDVCGRAFTKQSNLRAHQRDVHTDPENVPRQKVVTFNCELCDCKGFVNESDYKKHKKLEHNMSAAFNCDICGKR